MAQSIPETVKQWNVEGKDGIHSLVYSEHPIPELGDSQVLVKIQGASLNARDTLITQGKYPFALKDNVVPGSDGAGTVIAVGKHVTRFRPGDKVVTMLHQQHIAGPITFQITQSALGGSIDGTLRSVGAFNEQGLVFMPKGLSFMEAATLSCAGVTAWNALFGLPGKQVGPGQWVLTQGTGGVSLFAIQFAKNVGARVIATTSSNDKFDLLKRVGTDEIINYRETPEWGAKAKELTGGIGVDHVVDVAGPSTLKQSAAAVKLDGVVNVVGFVGGSQSKEDMPTLLDCWMSLYNSRGLWVGSRVQMEEMCRAIEANVEKMRPIVDENVFTLEQVKEAFKYLEDGRNVGKVCVEIE